MSTGESSSSTSASKLTAEEAMEALAGPDAKGMADLQEKVTPILVKLAADVETFGDMFQESKDEIGALHDSFDDMISRIDTMQGLLESTTSSLAVTMTRLEIKGVPPEKDKETDTQDIQDKDADPITSPPVDTDADRVTSPPVNTASNPISSSYTSNKRHASTTPAEIWKGMDQPSPTLNCA